MAGDWIKIEHALPNKPEVMRMADVLDISEHEVVGHLVCFWTWCDQNLSAFCPQVDGTKRGLDRVAGRTGFADAMVSVGWLSLKDGAIQIPNYDDHLAESAKKRGIDTKRKRNVRKPTGQNSDKTRTKLGLEKRREEKSNNKDASASCSESGKPTSEPTEFVFPTNGKGSKEFTLSKAKLDEYRESFPGVGVESELRKARQWCRDNPRRRKTPTGMPPFLTRWLGKAQDSGGGGPGAAASTSVSSEADVAWTQVRPVMWKLKGGVKGEERTQIINTVPEPARSIAASVGWDSFEKDRPEAAVQSEFKKLYNRKSKSA